MPDIDESMTMDVYDGSASQLLCIVASVRLAQGIELRMAPPETERGIWTPRWIHRLFKDRGRRLSQVTLEDMTVRKKTEEALRESSESFAERSGKQPRSHLRQAQRRQLHVYKPRVGKSL